MSSVSLPLTDRQRVRALARAARTDGIACRLSISERGYGAYSQAMRLLGVHGLNPPAQWAYTTINSREESLAYYTPYSGDRLVMELCLYCDSPATVAQIAALAASFGFHAEAHGSDCHLTTLGGED